MPAIFADYKPQRDAFDTLIQSGCNKRILTFQGASGTGKTCLVNACIAEIPEHVHNVHFNCKGSAVNVAEVFYRTIDALSWDRFQCFRERVADLSEAARVKVDHNSLFGIQNRISVILHAETQVDREERRAALTDAWFEDIRSLDKLLLISFDTYEDANLEIREWINGPFLVRAASAVPLRVLIAGQQVPDLHEHAGEWGRCCAFYELYGVKEAEHWLPVIQAMDRIVPTTGDPHTYMAGLCHALNGRPAEIVKLIAGFPKRTGRL